VADRGFGERFLDRQPTLKNQPNGRMFGEDQIPVDDLRRVCCGRSLFDFRRRIRGLREFFSELDLDVADLEFLQPRAAARSCFLKISRAMTMVAGQASEPMTDAQNASQFTAGFYCESAASGSVSARSRTLGSISRSTRSCARHQVVLVRIFAAEADESAGQTHLSK